MTKFLIDQGVLNHLFEGRWKPLPATYNFGFGMDTVAPRVPDGFLVPRDSLATEEDSQDYHYTGVSRGIKSASTVSGRGLVVYYGLEWSDIVMKNVISIKLASLVQAPPVCDLCFTNTYT